MSTCASSYRDDGGNMDTRTTEKVTSSSVGGPSRAVVTASQTCLQASLLTAKASHPADDAPRAAFAACLRDYGASAVDRQRRPERARSVNRGDSRTCGRLPSVRGGLRSVRDGVRSRRDGLRRQRDGLRSQRDGLRTRHRRYYSPFVIAMNTGSTRILVPSSLARSSCLESESGSAVTTTSTCLDMRGRTSKPALVASPSR